MTLKTNLHPYRVTAPGVLRSLRDGSIINFTPPVGGSTLWGSYVGAHTGETKAQAYARFHTRCGGTSQVIRCYDNNGGTTAVQAAINATGFAGTTPMVPSFKYDPVQVVANTYDSAIHTFFAAQPTAYPTYWCYYHEHDAKIIKGDFTLAQWQAAWIHIKGLADAVGNSMLKATAIWTGYSFTGSSGRLAQQYPGVAGYVDVVCVDPYQTANTLSSTTQQIMQPLYDAVMALNGPKFAVGETGTKTRQLSTTNTVNYVKGLGWLDGKAEFVTVFNQNPDAGGFNDEFDDLPAAAAYYGTLMNHA